MAAFGETLGLLEDDVGNLHMFRGGLVEGGGHDLGIHATLHVGHLLGTLVDEQDDQVDLGVVGGDGVGHVFQQDGLTGLGLCHDEAALSLADRGEEVHDAGRDGAALVPRDVELLVGEERREIVEGDAVAHFLGLAAVDEVDLHQGEELLASLGRTDDPEDGVASLQAH